MLKVYNKHFNPSLNDLDDDEQIQQIDTLKQVGKGNWNKYCFNYALPDYPLYCVEDGFDVLTDNYINIKLSEAKRGDIISMHLLEDETDRIGDWNCKHFAKIIRTASRVDNIIIRSKWGQLGIYEGKLSELPEFYGNNILIWRKKE